jgi:hypothetical protein
MAADRAADTLYETAQRHIPEDRKPSFIFTVIVIIYKLPYFLFCL